MHQRIIRKYYGNILHPAHAHAIVDPKCRVGRPKWPLQPIRWGVWFCKGSLKPQNQEPSFASSLCYVGRNNQISGLTTSLKAQLYFQGNAIIQCYTSIIKKSNTQYYTTYIITTERSRFQYDIKFQWIGNNLNRYKKWHVPQLRTWVALRYPWRSRLPVQTFAFHKFPNNFLKLRALVFEHELPLQSEPAGSQKVAMRGFQV